VLECCGLLVGELLAAAFGVKQQITHGGEVSVSFLVAHVLTSLQGAQMLGARDDGLLHVSVFDGHDPCSALTALDEAGAALETAVRHATLFSTVKNDGHAVAF
jgi:hypothetical protein